MFRSLFHKTRSTSSPPVSIQGPTLIVQMESNSINTFHCVINHKNDIENLAKLHSWNPAPFMTERNGTRLFEELCRRLRIDFSSLSDVVNLLISCPGTISRYTFIEGSSRLGIYDQVDARECFSALQIPNTFFLHDVECAAMGEALMLQDVPGAKPDLSRNFAFILIDEGIGAAFFIDGKPYHGAGLAGHLGRLMMEPSGTFHPKFASRGTLEVFAARPWVSQNVINEYLAEQGKYGALRDDHSPFRAAVKAAASSGQGDVLSYQQLAAGFSSGDPIATSVLTDTARYISLALNAVITIMNPPTIILGGGVVSSIPRMFDMIISSARRTSWAGSWNETTIVESKGARESQIRGACQLLPLAATGSG